MAERLVLEAMAAVDGSLPRWWAQCDRLRERGAFGASGVMGAYRTVLPADSLRDATASVYAEVAHHLGWLDLDRAVSDTQWQQVREGIVGWVAQDRTVSEVVETFGAPSLWVGATSRLHPKTLAYTTADRGDDLICFHLGNAVASSTPESDVRSVPAEAVVLAVRHRPGDFPGSFSFTPEGLHRRPTADQASPIRPTVWIFHGERARHAAGVFDTLEVGLAWAAAHHVTGILAEYPHGGAYDVAVADGRFTPSRAHHGTADHVAAFSPGLRHIHLTAGRPDR